MRKFMHHSKLSMHHFELFTHHSWQILHHSEFLVHYEPRSSLVQNIQFPFFLMLLFLFLFYSITFEHPLSFSIFLWGCSFSRLSSVSFFHSLPCISTLNWMFASRTTTTSTSTIYINAPLVLFHFLFHCFCIGFMDLRSTWCSFR